jgi:hypothetical protein
MRYFIYQNGQLKEVSDSEYESWMLTESRNFILPEFATIIDGNFYGLETMYYGSIDKGEEVLPFVLLYFEDIATIKEDKIDVDMEANSIDYFSTFEELQLNYNEKLNEIKLKTILE